MCKPIFVSNPTQLRWGCVEVELGLWQKNFQDFQFFNTVLLNCWRAVGGRTRFAMWLGTIPTWGVWKFCDIFFEMYFFKASFWGSHSVEQCQFILQDFIEQSVVGFHIELDISLLPMQVHNGVFKNYISKFSLIPPPPPRQHCQHKPWPPTPSPNLLA